MNKIMPSPSPVNNEPTRKLSPWRVLLAIVILASAIVTGIVASRQLATTAAASSHKPWFAGYVDVTATPRFAFEQMGSTRSRDLVLSFIVSSPSDACTPSWGASYTLSQADASLDLDRRIARLRQQGGRVAVSFGGEANQELATNCSDPSKLEAAYASVISRYNLDTIDLDIEKTNLSPAAGVRRAIAIAQLQKSLRASHKNLAVWATLPVAPTGLTDEGAAVVSGLLTAHVDLAGVNAMTMDYGASLSSGETMLSASKSALTATHRQLGILYLNAGTHLSDSTIWGKIGATPMIGQNDITGEVFTTKDAAGLNQFAVSEGIGRMSMWSANRDIACGDNYVDTAIVSTSCSGVSETPGSFAATLSTGFDGRLNLSAGLVTKPDASPRQVPDNPMSSPYQIWSPTGTYLEGTKVVWHHYVYQSKWWTQGDQPDNPVLQTWQTPWQLIGPVLPGETPIPQPTVPTGTYPAWSGTATYNTGDRVIFTGVPYQAKWWNTGASPAAATSNPDGSPWAPLTQTQINQILSAK